MVLININYQKIRKGRLTTLHFSLTLSSSIWHILFTALQLYIFFFSLCNVAFVEILFYFFCLVSSFLIICTLLFICISACGLLPNLILSVNVIFIPHSCSFFLLLFAFYHRMCLHYTFRLMFFNSFLLLIEIHKHEGQIVVEN